MNAITMNLAQCKLKWPVLAVAIMGVILDQAVKALIQCQMFPGQSIPIVPSIFNITLVYNTGAAFSLFEKFPAALLVLTTCLFLAILCIALVRPNLTKLDIMAYGLVLGGAAGNIIDRLFLGKVIDYLDVICIHYPIFNLADSFIFIGVCLLIIQQFRLNNVQS